MAPGFQKSACSPRISLAGGRGAYVGPGLDLAPHRNLAATVAIALQSPFSLQVLEPPQSGCPELSEIALISPGALHHLRADGDMAFIYLDALSDDYAQLKQYDLTARRAQIVELLLNEAPASDVNALCSALGVQKRTVKDARMSQIVRLIDERPQEFETIAQAAAIAGLSMSRFQSLFRQSVGMPFRRYRLWRRMAIVLVELSRGALLTNAALDAGFSSSAHLSSTFKAMFGLAPSSLVARGVRIERIV
jgi:methylphosphotriester-DNA--protein-cysteine methyltransferase